MARLSPRVPRNRRRDPIRIAANGDVSLDPEVDRLGARRRSDDQSLMVRIIDGTAVFA